MKLYTKVEQPADVRVLLPYVKVNERLQLVVDMLRAQQVQPEPHKVGRGDEYYTLLKKTWDEGEAFFVVEHDVGVWMGAIRQMSECEEDWCALPLMCHGRLITTTFGAVKFGKHMIERRPGFWDDIEPVWFHLDAGFADKMGWPYIRPHVHLPPATHLNEVQWPDEISTRYSLERKVVWQSMEEGQAVARINYRVPGDGRKMRRVTAAEVLKEGSIADG